MQPYMQARIDFEAGDLLEFDHIGDERPVRTVTGRCLAQEGALWARRILVWASLAFT